MTERGEEGLATPGEAFGILGNETRVNILQELAAAGEPLSFTELRNRVGIRQGAQFNYHLTKLVGHFVQKTADGYALRQAGRRVVEAVLAGAVEQGPHLEPTTVDYPCHFCGTSVEVSYEDGTFVLHCPGCLENEAIEDRGADADTARGNLARISFPPAGLAGRSPTEGFRAAATWVHLKAVALSSGVCPGCSAAVSYTIRACTEHELGTDSVCLHCEHVHAVKLDYTCPNCHAEFHHPVVMSLLSTPEVLAFVGGHGLNVTSMGLDWGWVYEEEVLSTEPFEGRFTIGIDDDHLTLTLDEHLNVVDAST